MTTNGNLTTKPWSEIPVDELRICGMITYDLKKNGINTVDDLVRHARSKGRLMYLPGIRACDEKEIIFALYDYGIDCLYPYLDAIEWMKIFDEGHYRQYREYLSNGEKTMNASGLGMALADVIEDKRMASALSEGTGANTVGELTVYIYIHGECLEDIPGIGEKYAERLDDILVRNRWNKDFDFLSVPEQQYIRSLMLDTKLYDLMKQETRSFMPLQEKGFNRLRDVALYVRAGYSLEDLFDQLGIYDEYERFAPLFMTALRAVDALTSPAL